MGNVTKHLKKKLTIEKLAGTIAQGSKDVFIKKEGNDLNVIDYGREKAKNSLLRT